ncbi:MAG: DUF615 domain-containing protein [Thiotrichales bacterium]|nr:DUF615 domain-containing protein [Thiotrichales bacterium]
MVRARNVNRASKGPKIVDWEQEEFDSRTQIKLAAQAVTDLGEQLTQLPPAIFKQMNLPPELRDAIEILQKIPNGPALRRQRAFIGKLLRQNEPLIIEIKEKLAEIEFKHKQQNAHFHKLEIWRDRLISEGDSALVELIERFPDADRQQLRQWIRNAQKELEEQKPPKASREMFKYLRGLAW